MELSSIKRSLTLAPPPRLSSPSSKDLRKGVGAMVFGFFLMTLSLPVLLFVMYVLCASMDSSIKAISGIISGTSMVFLGFALMSFGSSANEGFVRQEVTEATTSNTEQWKNKVLLPYLSEAYGVEITSEIRDDLTCWVAKNGESFLTRIEGVVFETQRFHGAPYLSARVDYSKLGLSRISALPKEK